MAAETGSGKTHSFLVPLIDKLCNEHDESANVASSDQGVSQPRKISLVLCPNVTLADQAVRMANGLCGENGEPLLSVVSLCGRQVLMLLLFGFGYRMMQLYGVTCITRWMWFTFSFRCAYQMFVILFSHKKTNFDCRDGQLMNLILLFRHQLLF